MNDREALGIVAGWAKQTIAFAVSVRALETGKELETEEQRIAAASETHDLTDELWEKTKQENGTSIPLPLLMTKYMRKVFDWCDTHINP